MFDWLAAMPTDVVLLVVFVVVGVESLGIPLPGETVLVLAALLAQSAGINPVWIGIAAALGAAIGDSIGYWIGRRYGRAALAALNRRFPRHVTAHRIRAATTEIRRHGPWAVFFGRFVAVLRMFAGPLSGIFHMPYPRFLAANVAGAVVWSAVVVTIVTFLGTVARELLHEFSWIALAIAAVIVLVLVVVIRMRARRRGGGPDAGSRRVLTTEEITALLRSPGSTGER